MFMFSHTCNYAKTYKHLGLLVHINKRSHTYTHLHAFAYTHTAYSTYACNHAYIIYMYTNHAIKKFF